ncbi:Lrp/AsnC family transcriptional regulator [Bacillus thermotolerans]|uniref:Transcriptional regulator, AsnC family n=1 Tax=Bacillus thermotolerans TaxID=1221996 RepID=A0A0F5HPJ6_BACTR|nr:Lrp/AsnC family transcriptional regulator [Bacillus thermotolerans]KKB34970.1 Transcriptional regulator, AsnC family [Bacillus thermotolerans]KKB40584.1 Transcriptional regulator, AsnC family [Bacillus thermotolerans]KKB42004.1 Transcriptional regulator, AsnC family [Bacillus thermotolerans]
MKINKKEQEILEILEKDARLTPADLSKMIGEDEEAVKSMIKRLEKEKVLVHYTALVDWSKVEDSEHVTAMIDVKVTPKRGVGFNETAERIYRFKEVSSVYLMSGAYDLSVTVEGRTMKEVARFVSEKLSVLEEVVSTTTHFQLKKYKHDGKIFEDKQTDNRMVVSP